MPFFTDKPRSHALTYSHGEDSLVLRQRDRVFRRTDIQSVWWRAVVAPAFPTENARLSEYCQTEYSSFLEGLEYALDKELWVSRPSSIVNAKNKPLQICIARKLGFQIPETVFTNDPAVARSRTSSRRTIFKSIRSPRVPIDSDAFHTVFTTVLDEQMLEHIDGIMTCPGIVQEFIDKVADIRVTVIGPHVFGVLIDSQSSERSRVDFRYGARDLKYRPFEIDAETADRCRRMLGILGLNFGAFDFTLTKDGELQFLEVNSNGQWGWLEECTGLPMRRALIDVLLHTTD